MSLQNTEKAGEPVHASRRKQLVAVAVGAAFLVGLIPMWALAHSRGVQRDREGQRVTVLQLDNDIATAALEAKRGEYESARQYTSDFFTQLRAAVDSGNALTGNQRNAVRRLLTQRDDVITLVARNDPAAVERLFGLEYQLGQDLTAKGQAQSAQN